MAASYQKQYSFNTGLVSPRLIGNANVAKYQNALAECMNLICGPYGYVTARPGFQFVAEANSSSVSSYLYPFKYSDEQTYILEFSNNIIRFFKDSGQILQGRGITNGTFTTDLSGWTTRNSGTGAVAQSSGVASFTSSGAGNEARIYQSIENLGVKQYTITCDVATNSITYRVGVTAGGSTLGTGTLTVGTGKTFNFTPTTNTTVFIEFQATANATLDNVVLSNPVYAIDSTYATADCDDLVIAQSFDSAYITNGNYAPKVLTRYGHDNWALTTVSLQDGPYLDENTTSTTITPSGVSGSVTLTASSSIFSSTDVGRLVRWKSGPDNTDAIQYNNPGSSQKFFDITFFPKDSDNVEVYRYSTTGAQTLLTYNAGTLGANDFKITSGQVEIYAALSSGEKLLIQRKNTGSGEWSWLQITAYSSGTSVTATVMGSNLGGTNASAYWRLGAFSETTGYPKLCVFHAQRLWFANTASQPDGLWASAIQDFENFSPDNSLNKGQIDADTAFGVVVSGIIAIKWMKATNTLLIGGEGIKSVNKGLSSVSLSNLTILPEEATICSDVEPIVTANEILFAENQRKSVRAVGFTFQSDAFTTENINLLTDNLFETSPVKKIVYQTAPFPVIWAIKDNGKLVSCTYDKTQEVVAWSEHTVGGTSVEVESIASIPQGTTSQVWATVKRTINGNTKRYVELMAEMFYLDTQQEAAFSDSFLVYSGSSVGTLTGLSHLEGQTVTIQSNGGVQTNKVVSSGSIILDLNTTYAVVGLPYEMYGRTVPLDTGAANGAAIGRKSRISDVILNMFETYGCEVGYLSSDLVEANLRPAGLTGGEAYDLYTGQYRLFSGGDTQDTYEIYFKNPYPLPFTIRNITYKVDINN
jgi:hypothetical protein